MFQQDLARRFARLRRKIWALVVTEDAFGLRKRVPLLGLVSSASPSLPVGGLVAGSDGATAFVRNRRWVFATTPAKVEAFEGWLKTQIEADMFEMAAGNIDNAWWSSYVREGYRKGAGRAFDDTRKVRAYADDPEAMAFYQGTKEEFLRSSFGRPVAINKVKLLAGRVFTELKGVTGEMATKITRNLTDGLTQGMNPRAIARRMIKDGIGDKKRGIQSRAERIARSEIIRSHAEGQLDALEELGVTDVGVTVEWSVTPDQRLCELCASMSGTVFKVTEARGLIPRHPNCRCSFIPANVGEDTKGQKRSKAEVQKAIDKSIQTEAPKRPLEEQKKRTPWAGVR
jgi:SPP1 gp7 family putative phage head morphogenesis protein